jgi:calcium-dependent protein kinase
MHRKTKKLFAVKSILKSKIQDVDVLRREIDILSEVDHPHIIHLEEVFEDANHLHLVTELCTGGELYDRVIEKAQSPEKHFSEMDAARIIRNILDAIRYIHDEKQIVHRDLKPENFLLLDKSDDSPVKIIDFGLSRRDDVGVMRSRVGKYLRELSVSFGIVLSLIGRYFFFIGTVYYVAPEVLFDDYTNKCDIWSIGVISYILLSGHPPFLGSTERETLQFVQESVISFPSPDWDDVSQKAIEFVSYLLQRDPETRPTASEALEHPWLQRDDIDPPGVSRRASFAGDLKDFRHASGNKLQLKSPKRSTFQKFRVMLSMKKAMNQVKL